MAKAKAAAARALEIDPDLAEADVSMGLVRGWYEFDWEKAEEEFKRAVDQRVMEFARAAGYDLGFAGVNGNSDRLHLSRVPVYTWDVGSVPFGLRHDALGVLGRVVAHAANRCAIGTSIMQLAKQRISPLPESIAGAASTRA